MMKKRMFFLIASVLFTVCAFSAEKLITFEQMPKQAQEFANKYFAPDDPLYRISYIMYDSELFDSSYMVVYANGDGLEFNKDGEWKDFDCKHCVVPAELVPAPIQAYVDANLAGQQIKKLERNRRSYEVKMSGGLELKFDLDGKLIEIDD